MKDIRYVVMGKNCPRSVGFTNQESALNYASHFKEKNKSCKPKIFEIENEKLKERFKRRFHNTDSYRRKVRGKR